MLLKFLADAIDPGLLLLALSSPWWERAAGPGARLTRWPIWLQLAGGLLLVYSVQALDERFLIWPRWGLDYSTHTAFAVATGATLVAVNRRRWMGPVLGVLVIYALLMRHFRYHSFADIVSSALVIAMGAWVVNHGILALRRAARNAPRT
jgi:hypothetical protein